MSHVIRLAAVLFIGLCLSATASGQELLRWKFEKGQALNVVVSQATLLETTAGSTPRRMSIDLTLEMSWSIDEVDAQQVATITQKFARLNAKLKVDGSESVEYDSAAKSQPIGAAQYFSAAGKLVGATLSLKMNDRGEILEVVPSDETAELLKGAVDSPALAALLSKEGLSDTLKQATLTLPEQPLEKDDTWTSASSAKLAIGQVAQKLTYTFQGPQEREGETLDAITVAAELTVKKTAGAKPSETALKEHQHAGTLFFDRAAGRFVESNIEQRLVTERPYRGTQVRVVATTTLKTTIQIAE